MTHERFYSRKLKKLNNELEARKAFLGESLKFQIVSKMIEQAIPMIAGTNLSLERRKEINKQIRSIEKTFYPLAKG